MTEGPGSSLSITRASKWARVAVAAPIADPLTYSLPEELQGRLCPGHAVLVPLAGRLVTGWVVGLLDQPDIPPEKIRFIERLLDPEPVLDPLRLEFLTWASRYYLSPLGETLSTALPAATRAKSQRVYLPAEGASTAIAEGGLEGPRALVLREILRRPGMNAQRAQRALEAEIEAPEVLAALEALRRADLIQVELREVGASRDLIKQVSLCIPADELLLRAPKAGGTMRDLVARVQESGGCVDLAQLCETLGPSARSSIDRLIQLGVLEMSARERRDLVEGDVLSGASSEPLPPNAAQRAAIDAILESPPSTWLLHGVTGSGKTEVYLQSAARVIGAGHQVLVLVPEISLTPQLLGRFRARFGESVAVLHSGLTGIERLRSWRRIRAGEMRVAVGARSALFAPFQDLGLLIVDEEHDDSYKQGEGVRYNARDLAVIRSRMSACPVVLGSATPSMESLHNVSEGRYRLLRLPERATPHAPPEIEIVNQREEPRTKNGSQALLSGRLEQLIRQALAAQGKAIILYNRRGWATLVQCAACGGTYTCPSCGLSLVLHMGIRKLVCHYCSFTVPFKDTCTLCGASELEILGQGTERVADELEALFPDAGIARMDADTTSSRGAHARILEDFRSGKSRILVGTQLVAKGHDFPDVHLAAIVGVDHILALPDFRSAERTYALVTQLAGRAGRGSAPGRVLLQTRHPEHFVFRLLGDPEAFVAEELKHRRILGYPPFTRLVLLRFESVDQTSVRAFAHECARRLRQDRPTDRSVDVLGPTSAPLSRLVGRWRYQILIRGRRFSSFRAWIEAVLPSIDAGVPRGIRLVVDVDPRDLM